MKKLRMSVTSIVVLAIVGSAFAFNGKRLATFCVRISPSTDCNVILKDMAFDPNGAPFSYYNGWDGQLSTCTGNHCTTSVNLEAN